MTVERKVNWGAIIKSIVTAIIVIIVSISMPHEPVHLYIISVGVWFIVFQNEMRISWVDRRDD